MTREKYLNRNTYEFFEKYSDFFKNTKLDIHYPKLGINRVECPDYYYDNMENALNLFYDVFMRRIDKIMDNLKIPFVKSICTHYYYDCPHLKYHVMIKDGKFISPRGYNLLKDNIQVIPLFSVFIEDINSPIKDAAKCNMELAKDEDLLFTNPVKVELYDHLSCMLKSPFPQIYLFDNIEDSNEYLNRVEKLLFKKNKVIESQLEKIIKHVTR